MCVEMAANSTPFNTNRFVGSCITGWISLAWPWNRLTVEEKFQRIILVRLDVEQ